MNKNNNGFSLIELLVSIGAISVIMTSAAVVLTNSKKAQAVSDLQSELEKVNLLATYQARSLAFFKQTLYYSKPLAGNTYYVNPTTNMTDPLFASCLSGEYAGNLGGCDQLSTPSSGYDTVLKSATGVQDSVQSTLNWRLICQADSCTQIKATVTTQVASIYAGEDTLKKYTPRISNFAFPARFLGEIAANSFSCASGASASVLLTIDFNNQTAVCETSTPQICNSQLPVKGWTFLPVDCPKLENADCSGGLGTSKFGFVQPGAWLGTSKCRGLYAAGNPPAPTPAATPAATPTPTPTPVASATPACSTWVISGGGACTGLCTTLASCTAKFGVPAGTISPGDSCSVCQPVGNCQESNEKYTMGCI